jgi:outer membrane protein assembly factor BamE
MIIRTLLILFFAATVTSGCNLIYKQNIQQGNAIEQEDLDELYIGMNQRQVLFVLGTPSVKDPFHPERWDYVQTFSRRGGDPVERKVTLYFEDGLLSEILGQQNPFGATVSESGAESLATFVKKPADQTSANPNQAAVDSAEEEVLQKAAPDIEAVDEREAEDSEYQRGMEVLEQKPPNDATGPDIDG